MQKKPDRRIQRTRQQLRQALIALIKERRYDALSVQEITERANLGRATFYLHYRDKDELLLECMDAIVDEFLERIRPYPVEQWALIDGAPILQVFEYAGEQAELYRAIINGQGAWQVTRRLQELISEKTGQLLEAQVQADGIQPRVPLHFLSNYFAGSLLALVFWWLENDQPYSPAEMVHMLRVVSLHGRAEALGLKPGKLPSAV